MTVSVCVVAYNEESVLPSILEDIRKQDYPHNKMEIILIDSMSLDSTKEIMEKFQKEQNDFIRVQVLENPGKRLAAGWNVALKSYVGDVILRVDAHASIPVDFVRKNMELQEAGEFVTGGLRPNVVEKSTPWTETLLLAEQSMFGSSMASYRRSTKKSYVKSIFHGAYRREVFDTVGGFDEQLGRTEDNEMNYRIRQAGYKICYSPEIISYQHTRSTLKTMLKQKYGNGYWVALTTKVCPACLSVFHFVPFMFVMGIIFTTILAIFKRPFLAFAMWSLYSVAAVTMSIFAIKEKKKCVQQLALPFLFLALHVSYGVGSLVGILKMPFWKYKEKVS